MNTKNICLMLLGIIAITSVSAQSGDYAVALPQVLRPWPVDCYGIWAHKPDIVEHHANVTETDWLRHCYGHWGEPGVRHIVNTAAAAGINALWWRANAGGAMMYPTNVHLGTYSNSPYMGYDYSRYDSFAMAVDYAHELGMKVYAWFCPFEESHSYFDSHRSRFADAYPELASKNIDGRSLQVPDFYYEEYQQYKLAIIEELITQWDTDGLVLDFERRGAPWRSPQYGYIEPIVEAFKAKTGRDPHEIGDRDPEWMKFRAEYFTAFIDRVKDRIEQLDRDFDLILYSTTTSTALSDVRMHDIATERCDFMAIMQTGPGGWSTAGDPVDAMKPVKDIDVPKMFVLYTYSDGVSSILEKARKAQDNDIHLCYFETTPLYRRDRYQAIATMAMADALTLSRTVQLDGRVAALVVRAIGLCDWQMTVNGQSVVSGSFRQEVEETVTDIRGDSTLTFDVTATRIDGTLGAGFAAVVTVILEDGRTQQITTDSHWDVALAGNAVPPVKTGKAGASPLVPELKD